MEELWRKCEEIWRNYKENKWRKYMKKIWKKYEGTMKKIWRNMKELWRIYEVIWRNYEGYMKKYEGNLKNYVGNMKIRTLPIGRGTWKNFKLILWSREGLGGGDSQFSSLGVPQRKDMKHVNMKEYVENKKKYVVLGTKRAKHSISL